MKRLIIAVAVLFVCVVLSIASLAALSAVGNGKAETNCEDTYREFRKEIMQSYSVIDFDCYDKGNEHIEEFYLGNGKGLRVTFDSKTKEITEVNAWEVQIPEEVSKSQLAF